MYNPIKDTSPITTGKYKKACPLHILKTKLSEITH